MKTIIRKTAYFLALLGLAACEPFDFDQEMGQKTICIISDNDLVYAGMHDLNDAESTGYISINCGGSLHIDRDVDVILEYAPEVLQQYNRIKFDIDETKYAKELSTNYYSIARLGLTLKADSPDTYGVMPIQIRPEGLSPDSIYLIPLRIKSVSTYAVNPDKSQVLYQINLKNLYARTDEATIYNAAGKIQREGEAERDAAASQTIHPLTKNSVRIFAGIKGYEKNEEVIKKNAIIVTVNDDNSLTMKPYNADYIEVASIDPERPDYYGNYELSDVFGGKKRQRFNLKYKYRFVGESKWEMVDLRTLRNVTLDQIND